MWWPCRQPTSLYPSTPPPTVYNGKEHSLSVVVVVNFECFAWMDLLLRRGNQFSSSFARVFSVCFCSRARWTVPVCHCTTTGIRIVSKWNNWHVPVDSETLARILRYTEHPADEMKHFPTATFSHGNISLIANSWVMTSESLSQSIAWFHQKLN